MYFITIGPRLGNNTIYIFISKGVKRAYNVASNVAVFTSTELLYSHLH